MDAAGAAETLNVVFLFRNFFAVYGLLVQSTPPNCIFVTLLLLHSIYCRVHSLENKSEKVDELNRNADGKNSSKLKCIIIIKRCIFDTRY